MKKGNTVLLWSGIGAFAVAVLVDGFLSGHGLGTVIACVYMIIVLIGSAFRVRNDKPTATPACRATSGQPIFAHVPGPGEPGYDPDYDPDDDKYWRRYYRD